MRDEEEGLARSDGGNDDSEEEGTDVDGKYGGEDVRVYTANDTTQALGSTPFCSETGLFSTRVAELRGETRGGCRWARNEGQWRRRRRRPPLGTLWA